MNAQLRNRFQSFLLENQLTAEELAALLEKECTAGEMQLDSHARQKLIESHAKELGLNLSEDVKDLAYSSKWQRRIDLFVNINEGDHRELLSLLLLAIMLRQSKLPVLEDMLRKVPGMSGRIQAVGRMDRKRMDDLVRQLKSEEQARYESFRDECVAALLDKDIDETCCELMEDVDNVIRKSDYVCFGNGELTELVAPCVKIIRGKCLQKALDKVDFKYPLHYRSKPEKFQGDPRFQDFVIGLYPWRNVDVFVASLMQEEESRRHEVNAAISVYTALFKSEKEIVVSSQNIQQYIQDGRGSCAKKVQLVVSRIRRDDLQKACKEANLKFRVLEDSDLFKKYVGGKGCQMIPTALVTSISMECDARRTVLLNLVGMTRSTIEAIREYKLRGEIEKYIEKGEGNATRIADAVSYYLYFKDLELAFGTLKGILSCANYDTARSWRDRRRGELSEMVQGFHNLLFPLSTHGIPGLSAEHGTDAQGTSEQGLAQLIVDFAEPTCFEFAKCNLSSALDCDARVVLLLSKSPACPWEDAERAVEVLRQERINRLKLINEAIPPRDDSPRQRIFADLDEAGMDRVWRQSDERANFVNGKTSLDEAVRKIAGDARRSILMKALSEGWLDASLAENDQRCVSFVGNASLEAYLAKAALSVLVSDLQDEKSSRLDILKKAFKDAGVSESDIGFILTDLYQVDSDRRCRRKFYGTYDFVIRDDDQHVFSAGKGYLKSLCCRYVEIADVSIEFVLEATIMNQRARKLESALQNHFEGWSNVQVQRCIRTHDKFQAFVAKIESGMATAEEAQSFISSFPEQGQQMIRTIDDYRSGYDEDDYDYDDDDDHYDYDGHLESWYYAEDEY